jgi:hypothetical protein
VLFKRLNREQPEQVFIVVQNNIGSGTAMAANSAVQLDISTSVDGIKAVKPTTAGLPAFLGICDAAIADQDYGLVQVFGYRSTCSIVMTDTSMPAGIQLSPVNANVAMSSLAMTTASNHGIGNFVVLVESTTTATGTGTVKVFIRSL